MYIQSFQAAAGSKITVTNTATNIFSLINTAQSTSLNFAGFSPRSNAIIIQPEDGDIRILFNNQAPTATNGFLISSGSIATLVNIPLASLQLIRTGGSNVVCSIQVGISDPSESSSVTGSGGGGSSDITSVIPGTGATNLGKAEDAATASGDTGVAILERRIDTLASSAGADGDYAFKNQDSIGASYSREVYAPSYEDNTNQVAKVEQRFSYSYISTATTTTIKSGTGFVHAITITESVASTIIVYDNTAGSGSIITSFVASAGVGTYTLDVTFATGLTIVTAGASKLTTSYR